VIRAAVGLDLETPHGLARAEVRPAAEPRGALVLGHGAGGSITARDLQAAAEAARTAGFSVALIEQPYRVAGRRSSPAARHLDSAWTAAVAELRAGVLAGLPLVAGGRSAGARVACRTAAATGAVAVLCLAFPLRPPPRATATARPQDRQGELDAVTLPLLVVQGASDRFGVPAGGPARRVVVVPGDHRLTSDLEAVADAVRAWLLEVVPAAV
jgi:predicted alpha/beta-hydrolase family hydrolase